jgi:hypothetical protein
MQFRGAARNWAPWLAAGLARGRETPYPWGMGKDPSGMGPGLRFWWFEGDAIHFDAPRYARLRGISLEEAMAELRKLAAEAMPDTPVKEVC